MFINLQVLSKNQNSLTKFLILLNSFCIKKQRRKNVYNIIKKLIVIKKLRRLPFKSFYKKQTLLRKNVYTYKIIKKKYQIKKTLNSLLSYLQQKQKRKVFTTLKSPHVNKTAQEQVEYRLFSKQIIIFSFQVFKFLVLIKKLRTKIFPDIKIQLKFILNDKIIKKTKLLTINPDNYETKQFFFYKNKTAIRSQIIKKKQIKFYLKLFDVYGELNFNYCLDSSVGRAKD